MSDPRVSRYYKDNEKDRESLQGKVKKEHAHSWQCRLFAGFFPRTGGDLVVPYGPNTEYEGSFDTTTAVNIFWQKVHGCRERAGCALCCGTAQYSVQRDRYLEALQVPVTCTALQVWKSAGVLL